MRKVYIPIQVVEKTKEKFFKRKGVRSADQYLNELMDKENA